MATATRLSTTLTMEPFLAANYGPEGEFVGVELEERRMGRFEHGRLRMLLGLWFGQHEEPWSVIVIAEQDALTTSSRFRIPDVAVVRFGRNARSPRRGRTRSASPLAIPTARCSRNASNIEP